MNAGTRKNISKGTYNLVFISSTFSFRLTNIHRLFNRTCTNECRTLLEKCTSHNNDNVTASEEVGRKIIQKNIMVLVNKAFRFEGLVNLMVGAYNIEVFQVFINYYLIHFSTSMNLRYKAYNTLISDIFTESDKELCILLLENNVEDYAKIYDKERKYQERKQDYIISKLIVCTIILDGIEKRY